MKINEKVPEIKRFLRATKDAFETKSTGDRYAVSFAFAIAQPIGEANVATVKSYLEALQKAVSAFSSTDVLSLQIDIVDMDSFEYQLVKETRDNFEASQKLEGKVAQNQSNEVDSPEQVPA